MTSLSPTTTLPLPNSPHRIPQLGFGVYLSPPSTTLSSVLSALNAGYRHIDTAQYYENEAQVGEAVKQSGLARSEVFLTTKILFPGEDDESTYHSVLASVERLAGKGGYVDLFLIHSPNGGLEKRRRMWLALERAKKEGHVRDIGVSNYSISHIEEIKTFGSVWPPACNQIELHPFCQQSRTASYCKTNSIPLAAYCPLVRNQKSTDPVLARIASKHNISVAQVLVRWSLQRGFVPLPKSDTPSRIEGNADVFGFELDEGDMAEVGGLDQGKEGALVQSVDE